MQSNQLTLNMLRDFLAVVIFTSLIGYSSTLQCNECNSFVDECSEDEPGRTEECAPDHGCLISLETGGDADVFIRMCSAEAGIEDKCINDGALKSCMCSSDLCNKNWVDAGFTDTTDTTTEPAPIKCYSCDSTQGECDKTHTGTEIDCAADFGCVINEDKELFFRGCAVDVKGCIDEADTRTCDCQTELCNFNWASAGAEDKIKCYSCDSKDGDCDEDHPGIEMDCPVEEGCTISKDKDLFFRGCSVDGVGGIGCQEHGDTRTCNCIEGLCNNNWVNAGYATDDPTDTPTEPAAIKCYSCDSTQGECDKTHTGTEIECAADFGCVINEDKELFFRGCAVDVKGCIDEADTRTCDCQTELCNFDWASAGAEDKIKCYSCDSKDGDCDEDHPGIEMDCPVEEGCTISKDKDLFFRGCSVEGVGGIGCQEDGETRTCNCMAGLCNNNWVDAGYASSDTTTTQTTPAGPTMKCYKCDSIGGGCTDEDKGEEVDCPESNGCTIRKTVTNDGSGMIRDCSSESDVLCDTIDNGDDVGGTTQFCNCDSPLCNSDWSTAGQSSGAATQVAQAAAVTMGSVFALLWL